MYPLLLQVEQFNEIQRSVRDTFQRGGSVTGVLMIVGGLAGLVLLVGWLSRRGEAQDRAHRKADPQQLFRDLLDDLDLTAEQRQWLLALIPKLRLEHPTAILLSPALFDRHVSSSPPTADDDRERQEGPPEPVAVRSRLFPATTEEVG